MKRTRKSKKGTFLSAMGKDGAEALPMALAAICDATDAPIGATQAFLYSVHGSRFAVDVLIGVYCEGESLCTAINIATDQWMKWRTGKILEVQYGIPRGLPYLVGFVIHYGMVANEI